MHASPTEPTTDRLQHREHRPTGPALDVVLSYHRACARGDLEAAMAHVADDVVCDAPAGRLEGAAAYRAFLAPFVQVVLGTQVLAAFGDEQRAVVVYDARTPLVASAPAAELVTVRDGRIVHSRFVFDRLPFHLARQARS